MSQSPTKFRVEVIIRIHVLDSEDEAEMVYVRDPKTGQWVGYVYST